MNEASSSSANCLCGATAINLDQVISKAGACHCSTCRKWGGGPFMTVDAGTGVTLSGEENIATFTSSDWADRGFCKQCGTHLFYRLKESQHYFVPVGLFDAPKVEFDHQVFIDEKPDFYAFANETQNMTGAELFAQFGGEQ